MATTEVSRQQYNSDVAKVMLRYLSKHFFPFIINIITGLTALLLVYLLCLAGFSTSHITIQEHSYFTKDNILINLLFVVGFISILYFIFNKYTKSKLIINKIKTDIIYYNSLKTKCFYIVFIVSFLFVMLTQKIPVADQWVVSDIAVQWMNKDFSCFLPGAYLDCYPNQIGIVLFHYIMGLIFGSKNFLIFQLCNVFGLIFLYKAFAEILNIEGYNSAYSVIFLIFCLFFIPAIMYTNFVYGNILGLSLSINCIKQILLFFNTNKLKNIFFCLIMAYCAITIKNNYIIFLIGIIFMVFIKTIKIPGKKSIFLLLSLTIIVFFNIVITNNIAQKITGVEVSSGMSKWSWIAMGLHENETMHNGWFNGYTYVSYLMSKYDSSVQSQVSKKYIKLKLKDFFHNKNYAVKFFSEKNASQWNNPTFQCVWINQVMPSNIQISPWINVLFSESGSKKMSIFLNYMQFIIIFGAIIFLFFEKNSKNHVTCCYCLIFIGGFVFHTFWEAKCQYTLPYFMLLLPMATSGYYDLCCWINQRAQRNKERAYAVTVACPPSPAQSPQQGN